MNIYYEYLSIILHDPYAVIILIHYFSYTCLLDLAN